MRIALVQSRYRESAPSGENLAVLQQLGALKKAGHEVKLFAKSTDEQLGKPLYHLGAALTVAFGRESSLLQGVTRFKPDIVHIHNLFPNIGWKWLESISAPKVVTLHNYRSFCAAGTAMLDGKQCFLCPTGGSHNAIANKCYRASTIATIPLAYQTRKRLPDSPLIRQADGLVYLSEAMREVFESFGTRDKLAHVIPNFVPPNSVHPDKKNGRWIWVGRLSEEKGLTNLLQIWPEGEPLDVFGAGPLHSELEALKLAGVTFNGFEQPDRLRKIMPEYLGMIVSSEMPGNSVGLVHLEAMASGLPVIALKGSSSAAEIQKSGQGSVFGSREELRTALTVWRSRDSVADEVLDRYGAEYSEGVWLDRILKFYEEVLGEVEQKL